MLQLSVVTEEYSNEKIRSLGDSYITANKDVRLID
jgi:hypothetical protein